MERITKQQFESNRIPRKVPKFAVGLLPWKEVEFYEHNEFVAVITEDKTDKDFGYTIFEKAPEKAVFLDSRIGFSHKNIAVYELESFITNMLR